MVIRKSKIVCSVAVSRLEFFFIHHRPVTYIFIKTPFEEQRITKLN